MTSQPTARHSPARLELAFVVIVTAYVALLGGFAVLGGWLLDGSGRPLPTDFVNVWAAGSLTLEGRAPEVYDYAAHRAAEERAIGRNFGHYFPWPYPPAFLLAAAPLAVLPYVPSFLAWMTLTLPLYLATIRLIAGRGRTVLLAGLAFPAAFWNVSAGQNGFLTTALLGCGLALVQRRPVLAGICIGLLTYKPQFGLLVPLALVAGRHWRVFLAAAATAVALALASALATGPDTWLAFVRSLPVTGRVAFVETSLPSAKLQSVMGVLRFAGASTELASLVQVAVSLACAVWVVLVWRRPHSFELRAATLAVASVLASPYVYVYDLVLLTLPIAFLARAGLAGAEIGAVTLASALILLSPVLLWPTAFIGMTVMALVVLRRGVEAWPGRCEPLQARAQGAGT